MERTIRNVHHRSKWKWRPKKRRNEEKTRISFSRIDSSRFFRLTTCWVKSWIAGSFALLLTASTTSVRDRVKRIFQRGSALFRLSFSISLPPHFFCASKSTSINYDFSRFRVAAATGCGRRRRDADGFIGHHKFSALCNPPHSSAHQSSENLSMSQLFPSSRYVNRRHRKK